MVSPWLKHKMYNDAFSSIMKNLFTNKKADWIIKLDESLIQPFRIQMVLSMNDELRVQTRWLDKYTFSLSPKMFLSLAWSVLPKTDRVPYSKYIRKVKEEEELGFLFSKIRKHFVLSDNDMRANHSRLLKVINKDKASWFIFYGIEKKLWKKHDVDFNQIKKQKGIGDFSA